MESNQIGNPHTLTRFDTDLNNLRSLLLKMGGVAEQHFSDAMAYLLEGDETRGQVAIDKDYEINKLELSIEDLAIHTIARYAPTANDLRMIMSIIKAVTDLERIGDKSEKLARIAGEIGPFIQSSEFLSHLRVMSRIVQGMLHDALDAFARQDAVAAEEIIRRDTHVNQEYNTVHAMLLSHMCVHPNSADLSLRILYCMRAIERIGDHCTNIAKHLIYQQKGQNVRHSELSQDKERTQI